LLSPDLSHLRVLRHVQVDRTTIALGQTPWSFAFRTGGPAGSSLMGGSVKAQPK
jgi:hypothetical protein